MNDSMGMEELQSKISAGIEEYFESYDWDKAWQRNLEAK
jgi:preprotein translocase subunit Sec61beta